MKILTIINPNAGDGKTLRLLSKIKKALSRNPHEFQWQVTQTPGEMRGEINNAPSMGFDVILLVGGDGTVHEAFSAIKETGLPLGLIPCGRGNDFARNIGLTLNLERSCFIPAKPLFREIDLPTVNNIPYGSIACTGFDADVNRYARDKRGYFGGTPGYIICVIKALRAFRPFNAEIEIDDYHWGGPVMMIAAANGPFYGGGMKIAPDAKMDDRLLDVCIIKEVSKWELLRQFPKVFQGKHSTHPKVILKSCRNVRVISTEKREIFADGEYVGNIPGTVSIGKQRIQIMPGSPG